MMCERVRDKERQSEMKILRNQGFKVREIGAVFGLSGERVRQIIGNTGDVRFRRTKVILASLNERQIADLSPGAVAASHMTTSLVLQKRSKLNHPYDRSTPNQITAQAGEELVSIELDRRGIKHKRMPLLHGFDIL